MMGMRYMICQWTTNRFRPSELTKHHPRCPLTVALFGYFGHDGYKLLEKSTGAVFRSCNIIFEEGTTCKDLVMPT